MKCGREMEGGEARQCPKNFINFERNVEYRDSVNAFRRELTLSEGES